MFGPYGNSPYDRRSTPFGVGTPSNVNYVAGYGSAPTPTQLFSGHSGHGVQGYVVAAMKTHVYDNPDAVATRQVISDRTKFKALEAALMKGGDEGIIAFNVFKNGLDAMKECEQERAAANTKMAADLVIESRLIAECAAERQFWADWEEEVDRIRNGFRPKKLNEVSLSIIAAENKIDMGTTHSEFFCSKFFIGDWDEIQALDHEEESAFVDFASRKNYSRSKCFLENLAMYKDDDSEVIPKDFKEDTLQAGGNWNTKTRKAFIGIYTGKLPDWVHKKYRFVPQKKSKGEQAECFLPTAEAKGVSFEAMQAAAGSLGDNNNPTSGAGANAGFGGFNHGAAPAPAPAPANGGAGFGGGFNAAAPPANGGAGFGGAPPASANGRAGFGSGFNSFQNNNPPTGGFFGNNGSNPPTGGAFFAHNNGGNP